MRKILLSVMGIAVCWALISPIMTASKAKAATPIPVPSPSSSFLCTGTFGGANATATLSFYPVDLNAKKVTDPTKGAKGAVFGQMVMTSAGSCAGPNPAAAIPGQPAKEASNSPCFHEPTFSGSIAASAPILPVPNSKKTVTAGIIETGTLTFGDPYPAPTGANANSMVGTEPLAGCSFPIVIEPFSSVASKQGSSAFIIISPAITGSCTAGTPKIALGCQGVHN